MLLAHTVEVEATKSCLPKTEVKRIHLLISDSHSYLLCSSSSSDPPLPLLQTFQAERGRRGNRREGGWTSFEGFGVSLGVSSGHRRGYRSDPLLVVVGSVYVRDGTFTWHRRTQDAVIASARGVSDGRICRRLFGAFYVKHVSACGNSNACIVDIGSRQSQG